MDKKEKFNIIFSIISLFGLSIAAIISHNYKALVVLLIIGILILGLYLVSINLDFSDIIKNKKLKKHYQVLKQKENKTLYDYIFMNAFTNKIVNVLKDGLKVKKIQNVNNLSCYIHRVNKIDIYFNYQKHYVELFIYNDKITYQIDTPEEYDILESNKQFEQIKTIYVNLNIISDFDIFVDLFSDVITNIKQDIDTFKLENKVDSFFNGRILSNFEASTSYLKLEGIVCTIGGIIFVPICSYIAYICYNDTKMKLENIVGYYTGLIIMVIALILLIGVLIYGLNYVFKCFNMVRDIKLKRMSVINKPLKRVRIIYDQPGKYNRHRTLRYIKLYYDEITLLLPLKYPESFIHVDKSELYDELLSVKTEIKYLTKSKLVVQGGSRYIQIVKKYIGE